MRRFVPLRLRKPAVITLAGVVFAAAWLAHGGRLWWISILVLVATAARAISWYRMGGQDSDEGALASSQPDERQQLVSLQSRSLGFNLTAVAAFIGLAAAIALKATWWWPFLAILAVTGFGYLFGLSTYGVGEPDADDDADTGFTGQSPVQY